MHEFLYIFVLAKVVVLLLLRHTVAKMEWVHVDADTMGME